VPAALAFFSDPVLNNRREAPALLLRKFEDLHVRTPDISFKSEEIVAVGDNVIARGQYSGTHLGVACLPVDGGLLAGVPPTGRKVAVQHIHCFKLRDGLIVKHTATRDALGMTCIT
jgi:predicted ester cyclase